MDHIESMDVRIQTVVKKLDAIAKAVDCYSTVTSEQAKFIKVAGHVGVGRYLGYKTRGWDKGLTS